MTSDPIDVLRGFDLACVTMDEDAARALSVDFDGAGDAPHRMFQQASRKRLRLRVPAAAWMDGSRAVLPVAIVREGQRAPSDLVWMLAERTIEGWSANGFVRGHARAAAWLAGWLGASTAPSELPSDPDAGAFRAVLRLALATGDTPPLRLGPDVDASAWASLRAACAAGPFALGVVRMLPGTDRRGVELHVAGDTHGLVLLRGDGHVTLLTVPPGLDGEDLARGLVYDWSTCQRGRETDEDMAALGFDVHLAHEAAATLQRAMLEARSDAPRRG